MLQLREVSQGEGQRRVMVLALEVVRQKFIMYSLFTQNIYVNVTRDHSSQNVEDVT